MRPIRRSRLYDGFYDSLSQFSGHERRTEGPEFVYLLACRMLKAAFGGCRGANSFNMIFIRDERACLSYDHTSWGEIPYQCYQQT